MTNKKQSNVPRASLAISVLALVVAMSGAAVALPGKQELSSKYIKDNAVKSVDLKDGKAVRGNDVTDESLTGADVAAETLAADDLAPDSAGSSEIADNAVTTQELADDAVNTQKIVANGVTSQDVADSGLGAVDLAPNSVGSSEVAADSVGSSELGPTVLRTDVFQIAANSSGGAYVNCPANETRLSGGASVPAGNGKGLQSAWPNGNNGWTNIIRNNTAAEIEVTAYVLCLQG